MSGGVLGRGLRVVGLVLLFVAVLLILTGHGLSGGLGKGSQSSALPGSVGVLSIGSIPVNAPVFVIGPNTLLSPVKGLLLNASITPIALSQLTETPSDSFIIIDWDYMKPLLINHYGLNSSSLVLSVLSRLLSRGDFIALYGNASDEGLMGLTLTLAWARGVNNELILSTGNSYAFRMLLTAVPLIPMRGDVMEIAYGGRGWLAIAPIHENQLINYIIPYMMMRSGLINALKVMQYVDPPGDPCWELWLQFYPQSSPNGVFENNEVTLIWLAPQWGGPYLNYYVNGLGGVSGW